MLCRYLFPFPAALVLTAVQGCGGPDAVFLPGVASGKERAAIPSSDACYVCHMPFQEEPLAAAHEEADVMCSTCHGPSQAHVKDENIGATPPDRVYRDGDVEEMCGKCHPRKDHPPVTREVREARLAAGRRARREIKGREIQPTAVCTDCHGRHWIPPLD